MDKIVMKIKQMVDDEPNKKVTKKKKLMNLLKYQVLIHKKIRTDL